MCVTNPEKSDEIQLNLLWLWDVNQTQFQAIHSFIRQIKVLMTWKKIELNRRDVLLAIIGKAIVI